MDFVKGFLQKKNKKIDSESIDKIDNLWYNI